MTSWGASRTVKRWGKAGQRLAPTERSEKEAQRVKEANRMANHREADTRASKAAHDRGELKPWRVTMALNLRQLYGPEVDTACDAAEPDVDDWEAGTLYPRWEQVVLLAKLVGNPVGFFYQGGEPATGTIFICGGSAELRREMAKPRPDPILQYTHDALVAAGIRAPRKTITEIRPAPVATYTGRLF